MELKKNIEKRVKELTGSSKNVSLEELCNYVNNKCYKEFKREYYFDCNSIREENWNYDLQGSLMVDNLIYNINRCHIEVSETFKRPLIIEWYYVNVCDENENTLADYIFI